MVVATSISPVLISGIAEAATTSGLTATAVANKNQWIVDSLPFTNTHKVSTVQTNDGDSSYVYSIINNDAQTFTVANASVPAGSVINSVTLYVVAKWVSLVPAVQKKFALGVENGWTFNEWADITVSGSYATYSRVMAINPLTASAWTDTEVNNWTTKFGFVRTNGAGSIRVTQLYVDIEYTAPAVCGDGMKEWTEVCDDGNTSETDGCTTTCTYTCTIDTDCSDATVCNGAEICNTTTHTCEAWTPLVVDDGLLCTVDSCDAIEGVSHTPIDTDSDGVGDCSDVCINNSYTTKTGGPENMGTSCSSDANACGVRDTGVIQCDGSCTATTPENPDEDGDTVADCDDNCPFIANTDQVDVDADGAGDVCDAPECGNRTTEWEESCDDGNNQNNDGCSSSCTIEICGDGVTQTSEQCDDANTNDLDACNNACRRNVCGDTVVNNWESCDDGNTTTEVCAYGQLECSVCTSSCQFAAGQTSYCGNERTEWEEVCDDGNTESGDGCSSSCTEEYCGDGYVDLEAWEECDEGSSEFWKKSKEWSYCSDSCTLITFPSCGDGAVNQEWEQCDDGNKNNLDSCSNSCQNRSPQWGWAASSIHSENTVLPPSLLETGPESDAAIVVPATTETVIQACEEDTYILERLQKLSAQSMEIIKIIPANYAKKLGTKALKLTTQMSHMLRNTADTEARNNSIRALVCKIEKLKEARGLKHQNIWADSGADEIDYLLQYLQDLAILQFVQ